jgi:hypothetical protein
MTTCGDSKKLKILLGISTSVYDQLENIPWAATILDFLNLTHPSSSG